MRPPFAAPTLDHSEVEAPAASGAAGAAGKGAATSSVTDEAVMSVRRLESTADLLRYRAEMPGFIEALGELNLLPAQDVERLAAATAPFCETDYALGDVERELGRLIGVLSGMQVRRGGVWRPLGKAVAEEAAGVAAVALRSAHRVHVCWL